MFKMNNYFKGKVLHLGKAMSVIFQFVSSKEIMYSVGNKIYSKVPESLLEPIDLLMNKLTKVYISDRHIVVNVYITDKNKDCYSGFYSDENMHMSSVDKLYASIIIVTEIKKKLVVIDNVETVVLHSHFSNDVTESLPGSVIKEMAKIYTTGSELSQPLELN